MRKWLLLSGSALLLLAGAAVLWPASPGQVASAPAVAVEPFTPVAVLAEPGAQGLALTGRVLDPLGKPVANAEVMLAASAQRALSTAACPVCDEPLLACEARETGLAVEAHLAAHQGALAAAMTVRTDEKGAFRFERLAGVSFSVWARAPAARLGTALRERAAPGDPVELVLPAVRSIAGTVLDESKAAIAGATVYAVFPPLALVTQAVSDERGRFELAGLGEGPFYVLASAKGFLPSAKQRVEAGPDPLQLTLGRPRKLEVSVTAQGRPAAASVAVSAHHLRRQAEAPRGAVTFDGLYGDEVTIVATQGERASGPHVVTLEAPVTRVSLELLDGGRLAVTVVDEAGEPVPTPHLELYAVSREEGGAEKDAQTGELVTFGPMVPGSYQLIVEAQGFRQQRLPVSIGKGETTLEVALTRAVMVSGKVLDEYGRPAPKIAVLVNPTGDSVVSDDQGRFDAEVPSAGRYELHAHHSDWGGGRLVVNAPAKDLELRLEPQGGVQVQVQLAGRRVEGAEATVWQAKSGSFRSDRASGADGVVLLRGLPPGTYTLVAEHPDHLPSTRQEITVVDGQLARVTAELREGAKLSGSVVDEGGAPVVDAAISVVPGRGARPVTTDAQGRFELSPLVPNGEYRLAVRHLSFEPAPPTRAAAGGPPVKITLKRRAMYRGRVLSEDGAPVTHYSVNEHQVDAADGRFELPLSTVEGQLIVSIDAPGFESLLLDKPPAPDLGDLTLKRMDALEGTVVDERGGPVGGAVVSCSVCEESSMSDEQGRFRMPRPTLPQATLVARKGRQSGSQRLDGRSGPVRIRVAGGTRLFGRVFAPSGQPAPGVELEISGDEEPSTVVTALDGSYQVELTPGSYRFRVTALGSDYEAQGYGREDLERMVVAEVTGAEQHLDFGPAPGTGSLTVRLPQARGRALWLVRGDPPAATLESPLGLERVAYSQLLFQPEGPKAVFSGLVPGRYTLISRASDDVVDAERPQLQRVDVAGPTEIALGR